MAFEFHETQTKKKEKNINSNQPRNKPNQYQSNQVKGKKTKNPSKILRDPRFELGVLT
jgi:hypothetical protein